MKNLLAISVALAALAAVPSVSSANCPAEWLTDVILCDDFDTYCSESSTGHPGGTKCPFTGATRVDQRLKEVWLREPRDEDSTEMLVEDEQQVLTSPPFGGRYPCQGEARLGTMTIRDWEHSPYPLSEDGQIRNLAWRIKDTFGSQYDSVEGTDEKPLVLEFLMSAGTSGKVFWDNGYMEVTLGEDRANTDYINHADCATYCNPPINQGPFPVICAQGNPTGPLPTGCPNVGSYPPPIRAALAVGTLGMLDYDPCHCGSDQAHGPANYHLNMFDGQKWWMLRSNTPQPTSGAIYPRKAADDPMPPPEGANLTTPGDFSLNEGAPKNAKSFHWIKLTIRSTTFKVEMTTQERSSVPVPGSNPAYYPQYYVTSIMDNIPRAYKYTGSGPGDFSGAFDSLRIGVGQGCQLRYNDSWTSCAAGTSRQPLRSRANSAGALGFDDIYFHGGRGFSQLGACCLPNGTCADSVAEADCLVLNGDYRGPGSACGDGSICVGACCKGQVAGCEDTTIDQCPAPFTFKGAGTSCATATCPCSTPFADADLDGDVDHFDFAAFQACFGGEGVAVTGVCKCYDRHPVGGDNDVDAYDWAKFEACASGPGVPLNPACDQ